ncbi:zinc finger domain-containing protein [Streptomyces inhibens]|uniref:zinc finger domain-containing protein n=1 Tax=Streptomyces inhibens TaxID=2293571 RepID=UPI003CC949EF
MTGHRDDVGAVCPRCGEALRRTRLAGRGAVWCPRCRPEQPHWPTCVRPPLPLPPRRPLPPLPPCTTPGNPPPPRAGWPPR